MGLLSLALGLFASTSFLIGLAVVSVITMAILLEFEKEGWATTVFSLAIAIVLWNFKGVLLGWVVTNPWPMVAFVVGYVVLGVVWSFLKWTSYVKGVFRSFKNAKEYFIEEYKELTDKTIKNFESYLRKAGVTHFSGNAIYVSQGDTVTELIDDITPKASRKKSVITSWIAYWPVSFLATVLNDPFRRFFEWVYETVSGVYDKITSHYKADLLK